MTLNQNVEFEIGLNAIGSYKRLSYDPWYALAEFVDNSTQSFRDNEEVLRSIANKNETPLTVEIDYNRENDHLRIYDNAMGMSLAELQRSMRVAQIPTNTSGRSKYGMGLKTASVWLGNYWIIRTKKLGLETEYTIKVDVNSLISGNNQLELEESHGFPLEEHYTIIEIYKHNRKLYKRTLDKISDYLSSIYRQDFRQNILTLKWMGKPLKWEELDSGLLTNREGKVYKREFDFVIPSINEQGEVIYKPINGWVGVLQSGSRSKAGFSILHSDRVVRGWPDAWRPESLYGQIQGSNDLVNQRLVGEIHLDHFDVSHTKDDILWIGDEEDEVENKLREHCGDYREVALAYRKRRNDERGPSEVAIRTAIDKLRKELISPEMRDIITANPMLPDSVVEEVIGAVRNSIVDKKPETFTTVIEGISIRGYIDDMSVSDPYLTLDTANASEIIIIVNASHPHWSQLKGSDGVLNYLRHCTYDGISEAQARDKKINSVRINPNTVKLLKDRLLRIPFEIEQNSDSDDEIEENEEDSTSVEDV